MHHGNGRGNDRRNVESTAKKHAEPAPTGNGPGRRKPATGVILSHHRATASDRPAQPTEPLHKP